ncbi:hypothetical protein J3F83DRAFT_339306 [Trichoderma novae-zelandiae]
MDLGHDVSTLMMALFGGSEKNEFGKEKGARLPLLLPKTMEGRPIASKSLLFSLPPEILGDIMDLLVDDKAALSALALVNSDCRQLARSCQFADICFDYGQRSTELLLHLFDEASTRLNQRPPGNVIRPPFIGSCIRSVTVRSRPEFVVDRHGDLYSSIWGEAAADTITLQKRDELRKTASDYYFKLYCPLLLTAIGGAMPHIETLLWYDRICLDEAFFRIVTRLPIRHLKLSKVYIGELLDLKLIAPSETRLETLSLDLTSCRGDHHRDNTTTDTAARETAALSRFIGSLLQCCSKTLVHLTLACSDFESDKLLSFGHEQVNLGRLRHLDISNCWDDLDTAAWCSLLSAPLRHLAIPFRRSKTLGPSTVTYQPLRDLETLVVPSLGHEDATEAQSVLDLISRHPHVRKLSVRNGQPKLMDSHLLPLLSDGRWSNLTSLSLAWRGPGIAEETAPNIATISAASLAAIGSIGSLEQLCLSAGEPGGWRHQWLIDHDLVRSSLRGLAKLKRLAFERDTYVKIGEPGPDVERYYESRWITSAEVLVAVERPDLDTLRPILRIEGSTDDDMGAHNFDIDGFDMFEIWERAHRNRMLGEAERYALTLPCLEWIYCGQWPMEIRTKQTREGANRTAVPLGEGRDSCWTLLRRMFEMREDED